MQHIFIIASHIYSLAKTTDTDLPPSPIPPPTHTHKKSRHTIVHVVQFFDSISTIGDK